MDNFWDFSRGLDDFTKREIPDALVKLKNKVTLDIFSRLILASPVDKGRFRSGWSTSLDNPSTFMPEEGLGSYGVPDATSALSPIIGGRPFQMIWITNNLPYGVKLNEGHSKQAPAGFVDIAVEQARGGI